MHRQYPGPTVIEANSIGLPLIQNLHLPEAELLEQTTTQASKQAMLTALELLLQQRTLKIHSSFQSLLAELADYRLPDGSLTQDSVMALGFAVANAEHAHAVASGGRINRTLFYELNDFGGPPPEWYDRPKFGNPAAGLIPGHRAPDNEHGGIRRPTRPRFTNCRFACSRLGTRRSDDPRRARPAGQRGVKAGLESRSHGRVASPAYWGRRPRGRTSLPLAIRR